ncbi:MAG: hypothetical protein KAS32_09045 [Candidatus Peribacteraceae bacterium]|nr:hypothetical protein [Candidatus Peribacteraceae bacterium]
MRHLFIFLLLISTVLSARVYDRNFGRGLKLPDQHVLESVTVTTPSTASTANILPGHPADISGVAVTVTAFEAVPGVARTIAITPTGVTADVKAGDAVITGTNIKGETITDTLAFLDNASTATTSVKAFKTITSILFPVEDSPYTATWAVGTTDAFGLDHCMAAAGDIAWATAAGARESTDPTCVADVDEMEKNVCDPNTAANASKSFVFYYIQNFRCF